MEKEAIIKDWIKSGLTAKDYQNAHEMKETTIYRWLKVLGIKDLEICDLLKALQLEYSILEKTVFIPFSRVETPPPAALELRDKYHYSLQLIID
ncbi:MAG: hypothetical protein II523_03965 [Bacteroidales bacterium]|nr:hypothetical protein [Bacteroidales bacterium]